MTGHLLMIAHDASRTGSNRVLLELANYLRSQPSTEIGIESIVSGPLSSSFSDATTVRSPRIGPAAVLANGSSIASELWSFPPTVPTAVYIHEDEEALINLTAASRGAIAERADMIICVSESLASSVERLGAQPQRIHVLPPVVTKQRSVGPAELADSRRQLGAASDDHRIVLGCGEAQWHKGPDLFVDIVRRLANLENCRFAWIGRRTRSFARMLDFDVASAEMTERVRWLGEVSDATSYLAAADVLVMPSRRDARPLSPLEAAFSGTPTVAFAVGGLADLAAAGAVSAVPYPDTVEFAERVRWMLTSPGAGTSLVASAAEIAGGPQSIELIGPQFAGLMAALIRRGQLV